MKDMKDTVRVKTRRVAGFLSNQYHVTITDENGNRVEGYGTSKADALENATKRFSK